MDKVPVWRRSGLFSMWKLDYGWRKWSTLLLRLIRQRLKRHLPADLLAPGAGGTCYERCLPMSFRMQMMAILLPLWMWYKRQLLRENHISLSLTKSSGLVLFNIQLLYQIKIHFSLFLSPLSTRFCLDKSVGIVEQQDHWIKLRPFWAFAMASAPSVYWMQGKAEAEWPAKETEGPLTGGQQGRMSFILPQYDLSAVLWRDRFPNIPSLKFPSLPLPSPGRQIRFLESKILAVLSLWLVLIAYGGCAVFKERGLQGMV